MALGTPNGSLMIPATIAGRGAHPVLTPHEPGLPRAD